MSDTFYTAKAEGEKVQGVHRRARLETGAEIDMGVHGVHRRARLETGAEIDMGVHGAIKAHYGLESQPNLPLPVDYLVAAAAG